MKETLRLDVPKNAAARGAQLFEGLQALGQKFEIVGDVRGGHGLMCALELVSDRASKTPAAKDIGLKVQETAYKAGVMVRASGPNIILSPPLILSEADVTDILAGLETGLASAS
jgi:adenosylmethionine-8-amino-7-oxononanoate aminotransferase